jgi:hypothetical protein
MSERNSAGSMDWPPIGSSLFPAGVNVRQEDGGIGVQVGVRVSDFSIDRPDYLPTKTEENVDPSLLDRTSSLQEFREFRSTLAQVRRKPLYSTQPDDDFEALHGTQSTSPAPSANKDVVHGTVVQNGASPPRPLLPAIDSIEMTDNDDESPCASIDLRKGRRANDYRNISRPRDIPRLDYGLPGDFGERVQSSEGRRHFSLILAVPGFGGVSQERQALDRDEFAFIVPLDCPTSTPMASRKRPGLPGSRAGMSAKAAKALRWCRSSLPYAT